MWPLLFLVVPLVSYQAPVDVPRGSGAAGVAAPSVYEVRRAEHSRGADSAVLAAALASGDTVLAQLAVRAYGRWEQPRFAPMVRSMLRSPAASVRREALNALAQMQAPIDVLTLLPAERDASVRAVLFESIGRSPAARPGSPTAPPAPAVLDALVYGLRDEGLVARIGAARGLESLLRRTARAHRPSAETVSALRAAIRDNNHAELRQLALLSLTAAADRDSSTIAIAVRDTSAQVRRLAVALSRQWIEDPSPMVRYQALRVAGTCDRGIAALRDPSEHVVLTAIEVLGEKQCTQAPLDSLVRSGGNWRVQTRALMALTKVNATAARGHVAKLRSMSTWQGRAWVAQAAKVLKDSATLRVLARDKAPNVAAAAMSTTDEALRALSSTHSGLVLEAATQLKGNAALPTFAPQLTTSLLRLSAARSATNRDPRVALLQRLLESADSASAIRLTPLLADIDPEVASLAARVITTRARITSTARTTRYQPAAFPDEATLRSLMGAKAEVTIRNVGTIEIALLPDDAPATVATFVALAERGAFRGLTWHRIVPNFVLQGGSPGADEYDGLTTTFMHDEVGLARHARGTFGISTRGRDTGDGQLFINLVDNFRLDHDYTVFATLTSGMAVMDRVQEGDVIEQVRIVRASR